MDEFFDIFDAVSALNDLTDLTDHSDALLSALDGLGYIDFDSDGLSLIDDLATFNSDAIENIAQLDPSEFLDPADFNGEAWSSFDTLDASTVMDFGDVAQFVDNELADYPDHLMNGLDGIEYHPEPHPDAFGWWEPHGDSAHIELFDRQEALPVTLHHEMAHHLMSGNPELLEAIAPQMSNSPLVELMDLDLSKYSLDQQPKEFVAETFAYFKTKPALLQQLDPELFDRFARWWKAHDALA